jgi:hypothetical protein
MPSQSLSNQGSEYCHGGRTVSEDNVHDRTQAFDEQYIWTDEHNVAYIWLLDTYRDQSYEN